MFCVGYLSYKLWTLRVPRAFSRGIRFRQALRDLLGVKVMQIQV
jgi:hypothetical protein